MLNWITRPMTRRSALGAAAALGAIGVGGSRTAAQDHGGHAIPAPATSAGAAPNAASAHAANDGNRLMGTVDHARNGFDPAEPRHANSNTTSDGTQTISDTD